MKETREGHFAVLITGEEGKTFPECKFPRLEPSDPALFLFISKRRSNPPRFNMFGGRRKPTDLTGLAGLHRELRGEAGEHVSFEVMGQIGSPLYFEAPTHHDYAYPYLCLHTSGEPLEETEETTGYERVTVANVGNFPYVPGSKPDKLGRTEQMVQYGITLCEIPRFHYLIEEEREISVQLTPDTITDTRHLLEELQPSENIHVIDNWMFLRTTTMLTGWRLIGQDELVQARAHK